MGGERDAPVATQAINTPPAYENTLSPSASSEITNDAKGSDAAQEQAQQSRPPPSSAGHSTTTVFERYAGSPGWSTVTFRMAPSPYSQEYQAASWAASLFVRCDDVARLMRDGFFWSTDNIVPEEGYMFSTVNSKWRAWGLKYGRVWILADKSHGESPRWVGYLEIATRFFHTLTSFRPQHLLGTDVTLVLAKNGRDQCVYGYDRRWAEHCYNCIYDDEPLQGWWPWPKESGHAAVDPFHGAVTWEDELFVSGSFASVPDGSEPGENAGSAQESTSCSVGCHQGTTSCNAGTQQASTSCVLM